MGEAQRVGVGCGGNQVCRPDLDESWRRGGGPYTFGTCVVAYHVGWGGGGGGLLFGRGSGGAAGEAIRLGRETLAGATG